MPDGGMSRGQIIERDYMKEFQRALEAQFERELTSQFITAPEQPKKPVAPANPRARKMRFE